MTSPVPPPLALLDAAPAAPLDPAVWSANLAALQDTQPELAHELACQALPPTWRSVRALDDSLTLRLEEPGQEPRWLAGTAMPRQRAQSLLAKFDAREQNCALASVSSGAELHLLLAGLPPQHAVFVFADAPLDVVAALHLYDYSTAIRAGRCFFVPCDQEVAFLGELLCRQPGLQPPTTVVLPDLTSRTRVDQIQRICRTAGECLPAREARLAQLTGRPAMPAEPIQPAAPLRLAVLSLTADPLQEPLAAQLTAAARQLGWDVVSRTATTPAWDHPLAYAELLASYRPHLTILLNHLPGLLPVGLTGRLCIWWQRDAIVPSRPSLPGVTHLAASPRVAAALCAAGLAPDEIVPWYWACAAQIAPGATAAPECATSPWVLVAADLPPADSQAFGLEQESQQRLWARLRVVVGQSWETPRVLRPEQLLAQAQRESGVELTDVPLRNAFLELIGTAIVPGVVLEHIVRSLSHEDLAIAVVGRGWQAWPGPLRNLGDDLLLLAERAALHPLACIVAGQRDPLGPTLLEAAARGWPLLVHALGGTPLAPELGDVLQPGQHFEACKELADIRRALEFVRGGSAASQRRVSRARDHVRTRHSYAHRLQALAATVAGRSQV